jgi:hypothetical protein
VSHIRPEPKAPKRRKSDCKKGLHDYGATQNIGAGIARRVCARCSAVTIDLTSTYELGAPVKSSHPSITSMTPGDS